MECVEQVFGPHSLRKQWRFGVDRPAVEQKGESGLLLGDGFDVPIISAQEHTGHARNERDDVPGHDVPRLANWGKMPVDEESNHLRCDQVQIETQIRNLETECDEVRRREPHDSFSPLIP